MWSAESGLKVPRFAFLDLETTGGDASRDRITEIGIVWLDDGVCIGEWSTLINPGMAIPPEIQTLTGISNAMVRDAPPFAAVADELRERLKGCVLVAHSARFDYGFIKAAFRALGQRFRSEILCTVRLSRLMFPEHERHGLDALVVRHELGGEGRHRALGDARLIAKFFQQIAAQEDPARLGQALTSLLRYPARPDHLPEEALEDLPEGPGVYTFLGVNGQPLYIGKAKNLHDRVRSHFYADSSNSTDARLAREAYGLQIEETAGEFCALVREIQLIRANAPLHNLALRRQEANCFLRMSPLLQGPSFLPLAEFDPTGAAGLHGPFSSRSAARAALAAIGRQHRLCDGAIGLWTGDRACFSRQIGRCLGLCRGEEAPEAHYERMMEALKPLRFPTWPYDGLVRFTETNPDSGKSQSLLFDQWCVIDPTRLEPMEFHPEVFKLLRRRIQRQPGQFEAVGGMGGDQESFLSSSFAEATAELKTS
jgi:DNA polymerase III subunit epsilon